MYRELYYGGEAVGSVFLWDLDSGVGGSDAGTGGLAGCFAVKKRESMSMPWLLYVWAMVRSSVDTPD